MAKPIDAAGVRRILVIKWSAMGDVVGATTFIDDICAAFPAAEIHLNTLPPWGRLFEGDSRFARVLAIAETSPRFATAYLPASDIVLNRLELEQSARAAASIRAAEGVFAAALRLRSAGYDIVIVGMPGVGAEANAVLASTIPAGTPPTLDSIAPTLLALMGFPTSSEMSPDLFVATASAPSRIATYGDRDVESGRATPSDEYYESLRSLGYIR